MTRLPGGFLALSGAVRVGGAVALVAVFLATGIGAPGASAAGTSLTIAPATLALSPGGTGEVDVVLTSDTPTRGIQFGLKYDQSVLSVDKASDGTFYQSWAKSQGVQASTLIQFRPDNSKGRVSIGGIAVLGGPGKGATGAAPVLHLALSAPANASGQTTLEITDVSVSDAGVNAVHPIPGVTTVGATIAVGRGLDSSSLQAPSAAAASAVQAPPEPLFGIGEHGLGQGAVTPTPLAAAPSAPNAVRAEAPTVVPRQANAPAQQAPAPDPQATVAPQQATVADQQSNVAAQSVAPVTVQPGVGGTQAFAGLPQQSAPSGQQAALAGAMPTLQPSTSGQGGALGSVPPTPVANVSNPAQGQTVPGAASAAGAVAAGSVGQTPLTPRPLATPTRSAVAAAPISAPRASTGLLIPYEVLAGIGGGIAAGGLVLYAMRAREKEAQE